VVIGWGVLEEFRGFDGEEDCGSFVVFKGLILD
jgi:hypothetical protein